MGWMCAKMMRRRVALPWQDKVAALYGKDLPGQAGSEAAGARGGGGEEPLALMQGEGDAEAAAAQVDTKDEDKGTGKETYFVATIIVAVVEKEGEAGPDGILPVPPTPQALQDLQAASPDNLLSLELLWAPTEGNRWLKKEEVLQGLAIQRDQVAAQPPPPSSLFCLPLCLPRASPAPAPRLPWLPI